MITIIIIVIIIVPTMTTTVLIITILIWLCLLIIKFIADVTIVTASISVITIDNHSLSLPLL